VRDDPTAGSVSCAGLANAVRAEDPAGLPVVRPTTPGPHVEGAHMLAAAQQPIGGYGLFDHGGADHLLHARDGQVSVAAQDGRAPSNAGWVG